MVDEMDHGLIWDGVLERAEPAEDDRLVWRSLTRAESDADVADLLWDIPPKSTTDLDVWEIPKHSDDITMKGLPKPSRIAAEQEPGLIRALLAVWRAHAAGIDMRALTAACGSDGALGDVFAALQPSVLGERQTAALLPRLIKAVHLGAAVGAEPLRAAGVVVREVGGSESKQRGVVLSLSAVNEQAVAFAEQHAADLVDAPADVQARIRALIVRSIAQGIPPAELARLIRDEIGLDNGRAEAVENFRSRLVAQGVADTVREARVSRYAAAKLNERSIAIARTELISSLGAGQQTLWDQAVSSGVIHENQFFKIWIISGLDTTCSICLDNEAAEDVPIDGEFPSGDLYPAAHTNCVCSCGLANRESEEN